MTEIAYTRNYVTQQHLASAYRRLGHAATAPAWSATLLIDIGLNMHWACPVLEHGHELDGTPVARPGWNVIAEAGELDYPPLRPEDEIWANLLAENPVPTGEHAQSQAAIVGKSVEDWHRDALRRHYLTEAHIAGSKLKRNPTDVNFDPLVRDWDATARQLADFLDTHRPPRLTAEQRVMVQGVRLARLEAELANTKASLGNLMRNAARAQGEKLRRGFKTDMANWGGVSRPTVDAWLSGGGCCEGAIPDEDGTATHQRAEQ